MSAELRSTSRGVLPAILLIAWAPFARAQSAFNFDLPPQPLADALRAVASVTHTDVVFDPTVVAGIEAPALKGNATERQALSRLLARTGLRCFRVGDRTIRIARVRARDPASGSNAASGAHAGAHSPRSAGSGAPLTIARATRRARSRNAAASPAPRTEPVKLGEVVVTGTRIAGTTPVSPVVTFDHEAIQASGYGSVGQFLLTVPENFSGGQNPGVIGARGNNQFSISGASSANLFGLGADSTLTLVDGHRFAYDAYQNGVDLSLIPLAAVDRIEIMTGGASAIYGSDAVAGVVNVILKKHYDGITADARYGDVTTGHASRAQYSLLAGHDWGSGNVLVAYEYAHDNPLYASQRPFSANADHPIALFPELNRDSVFLTAHQGLSSFMTASLDALYTARSYVGVFTVGPAGDETIDYADVGVHEYGVSPSLIIALPGNWRLSLEGSVSRDRDKEVSPQYSAVMHHLFHRGILYYQNDLRSADVQATGSVLTLPSGPLKVAVGAGYRSEGFRSSDPTNPSSPPTDASRSDRYAYLEADAPLVKADPGRLLLKRLSLSAAFRYDRYSDFGTQHTPAIGFAYQPLKFIQLRATWSESFRAPELLDVYGARQLYLEPTSFFGGASGTATMIAYGSNPALGPESATSRTVSLYLTPPGVWHLKVRATYFYIHYSDRIVQPVEDLTQSLNNPLDVPFFVSHPAPAEQAALIARSSFFTNFSGAPYDPASVAYFLNDEYENAAVQRIHGVDVTVRGAWPVLGGDLNVSENAAWLTLLQQTVRGAPEVRLSGTIFNPPNFKDRASATWRRAGWALTAAFNYVSPEWDNSRRPAVRVASWSTVDAQISYDFDATAVSGLRGLQASVSVQNLFDRDPPFVAATSTTYSGLGYDSTNASPLGRFVSLYVAKRW